MGLVKSRTWQGCGVFVHQVSEERATALLGNHFYFQHLTIDDLYQIRTVSRTYIWRLMTKRRRQGTTAVGKPAEG